MENTLNEQIIKSAIKSRVKTHDAFWRIVSKISRQNKIPTPPTSELLKIFRKLALPHLSSPSREGEVWRGLENILCKRPVRTLSGVAIITVLTKPFKCPGKCIYCPNEPGMPKSYLSNEPAAARAKSNNFNPYNQVKMRLDTLKSNGHPTDKIELIVKGGSWNAYPQKYREWFIAECFRACNLASRGNPKSETSPTPSLPLPKGEGKGGGQNPKSKFQNLKSEQKQNEVAKHRIIGLTVETRPDMINEEEILHLRKIGCTRVELGVQTIYDNILKKCHRGHGVKEIIKATKILKDAGFKVDYHLMPGLPGSNFKKDIKMFKEIFKNPDFMPDQIKVYPCTVIPGTELYNLWKRGNYKPLGDKQLIKMLVAVKSNLIPRFCRIARLIRDIPSQSIAAGNKITNLREYIQREMEKRGLKCKCLRCREVGHAKNPKSEARNPKQIQNSNFSPFGRSPTGGQNSKSARIPLGSYPLGSRWDPTGSQRDGIPEGQLPLSPPVSRSEIGGVRGGKIPKLYMEKYEASDGMEYFLSFEDRKREAVYAFLRLRLPSVVCHSRESGNPVNVFWIPHQVRNDKIAVGLKHFIPELQDAALIRELHTYGHLAALETQKLKNRETKKQNEVQHTGFGKKLMEKAEEIAQKAGFRKVAVISGIGVRGYYLKLGYKLGGTYMIKKLKRDLDSGI